MNNETKWLSVTLKGIIWICLGVVFFSALLVSGKLFFPFIVTKTVTFNIAVEIMFLAFLLLAWKDSSYKLRINWSVILIAVYLGILTVASLLGNDFYHSFWSNNERSDGILLLIHLFLFVWTLTSFLRTMKEWLYAFDLFLAASICVSIVSLDQFFALTFPGSWKDHFIPSSNGSRLAATIGNAGYVGGYMIFGVFTALFLLFKRKNVWLKGFYGIILLLEAFIAIQTFTRGAYLALGFGIAVFVFYLLWFYFNKTYLKIIAVAVVLLGILSVGLIFANSSAPLVQNNPILSRIASIADSGGTANNRIITWGFAWQGIKERPILGYGQENFYQVFDKYYTTKNTEQWFDRSHNMLFDRAVTGGFVGLIGYLAMLLLPFYFLWRYYFIKFKNEEVTAGHPGRRYFTPVIFTILIFAYIIQNSFIFEALVTYIPLMTIIAFAGVYSPHYEFKLLDKEKFKMILFIAFFIFFIPSVYVFNLKPLYANADFIKILSSGNMSLDQRMESFQDVINRNTLGNQEYRRQYFMMFENVMSSFLQNQTGSQFPPEKVMQFAAVMEKQLNDQIKENPYSVTNWLLLIRFYNLSYVFDTTRLEKAIGAYQQALKLSYGRPQVHYEGATSYYYLAEYNMYNKEIEKANANYRLALQNFYEGAALNMDKAQAFDQLSSFLSSVKRFPNFIVAVNSSNIGAKKLTDITAEMISWMNEAEKVPGADPSITAQRKAALKEILQAFYNIDKKNAELKKQLVELK